MELDVKVFGEKAYEKSRSILATGGSCALNGYEGAGSAYAVSRRRRVTRAAKSDAIMSQCCARQRWIASKTQHKSHAAWKQRALVEDTASERGTIMISRRQSWSRGGGERWKLETGSPSRKKSY